MTIDIDAIRQRVERYSQPGIGSGKTIQAIDLANKDVPALLAKVDELTAELEKVQAERGEFRDSALMYATTTAERNNQITNVRRLCDEYKDQPPPIFQGPGLSERGEGYNAGTRDMARAVLDTLTEAVDR